MPRLVTRLVLALAAAGIAAPAAALDPAKQLSQYGHRSWTQQQGLPQDSVRAIAQAPDGALWIGTDEGLARFDGTDFTVYRQGEGGLPGSVGICSRTARAVCGWAPARCANRLRWPKNAWPWRGAWRSTA